MPKRNDISSILIIGAGPIVIGQACEFDYSGAQACKALREEGYRVILVNSNPATIMTDPEFADATYIEPITPEMVEKIIIKEKPDALLPTMGGQTALNTALALAESGVLDRHGVELIGAKKEAIAKAEDRQLFRDAMDKIGLSTPISAVVRDMTTAREKMKEIGLPVIIRPSFTLGGAGGGIAYNSDEFDEIVQGGIDASPINEVLIEQSVLGWKEFEMEVVRDRADNCIIVCSIENIDPMGIHTGDSVTVAPALTLTDKEFQIMRNASIAVLREIGVDTGGSNVQFAVNPKNGDLVVIEMNPRVSRSSALASKATGFPIAKIAAKLAVGYTLDELQNDITRVTPASFEPTLDYVVVKIPRFTFEKFPGAQPLLTTSMKSVGEAMAIGRSFPEAYQKALRSMETGLSGLDEIEIEGAPSKDALIKALAQPVPDRGLLIAQAFRHGLSIEDAAKASSYDPWFLGQIKMLVDVETEVIASGLPEDSNGMARLKRLGFSDVRLAKLAQLKEENVRRLRHNLGVKPVYKRIDTSAAEFPSSTAYMYSCYEDPATGAPECEAAPSNSKKIMILGGGPNRIGQGIEFDYCCVHAAYALAEAGFETIMVNCNPETVSTDYDTSDRLYFEPLTAEDVLEIGNLEASTGELLGAIVQFGGQTPLKLAAALEAEGIPVLGTSPDAIDLAEDRKRFQQLLNDLNLRQPPNGTATNEFEAEAIANQIGYPVLLRPSYVLGGRAMEIVHDAEDLRRYMQTAVKASGDNPVLVDRYLANAIEVDVDALGDGTDVRIAGVMEHIEEAGVHSGDSACALPPHSLAAETIAEISRQVIEMGKALKVKGLMNAQFAVQPADNNDSIFVLEVNPRASRTAPFVAKATGVPIAKLAARAMAGEMLDDLPALNPSPRQIAVKEAVFPFARFPGVDILLGPEMKSTGEAMGLDTDFGRAFAKSQIGGGAVLPMEGTIFISVRNHDKPLLTASAQHCVEMGFKILATEGTADFLNSSGIPATRINKVLEGRPHIVDAIKSNQVQLVINTSEGIESIRDSFSLRRAALLERVPYYTTAAGAIAAVKAISALKSGALEVSPLQSYFR